MYVTHSQQDTFAFGRALGEHLSKGDTVLLNGDLGAGKSVLARGVARGLGITCAMASPTFTLMQPYEGREKVYHFDLYRLEDIDEYYAAGLDEYVGTDGVALVEWPLADMETGATLTLCLARGDGDDDRRISMRSEGMANRMNQITLALAQWEEKA